MSGPARVRKSSPCSKAGPMRATLPVSSLLRQAGSAAGLRRSGAGSPTAVSPTWRTRGSPDSSGQRSPGALCRGGPQSGKARTLGARHGCDGPAGQARIRRTASLDAIYLQGQWPRDSHYLHACSLLVDKATQTEEAPPRRLPQAAAEPVPDEKLEKYFRHRLQRAGKDGASSRERTAAFGLIALPGDHSVLPPPPQPAAKASPVNIPARPLRAPMRSSVEGLNQEIEGLVLRSGPGEQDAAVEDRYARYREHATPEGHRAPLAELFRATRSVTSVNTQTPAADFPSSSYSSGPSSRNSESPLVLGSMDASRPSSDLLQGGSRGSTPEQEREGRLGTSPHINRFLAREPPDGCEKVNTKFVEEVRRPMVDLSKLDYCSKPCVAFQLKPSLGSAFLPLQQQVSSTITVSATSSLNATPTTPPPNP